MTHLPFIETDKKGKATFSFFTNDKAGAVEILVKGMTEKGISVSMVKR